MNNEPKKSIRDTVLDSIKEGNVTMRPKWHFILRGALLCSGSILVVLTLLYLASFILFVLHQNGVWFLPAFGFRGLGIFFFSLPWILILIAGVFIILLELLVRQYSFGYRKPLLYSTLGVIGIVIVGGIILAQTSLHPRFYNNARAGKLPFAGELYREFGMRPPHNIHPSTITEIGENRFRAIDPRDEIVEIIITKDTEFPRGTNFVVGDRILVVGERVNTTITARGIRKIDDDPLRKSQLRTHAPRMYKP